MKRIQRNALILLGVFIAGGLIFYGWSMAVSILIGGALSILNFQWLVSGVDRVIYGDLRKGILSAVLKYVGRLVLILVVLFVMIHTSFLSVLGALLGLSVFVVAGMLEAVLMMFKTR